MGSSTRRLSIRPPKSIQPFARVGIGTGVVGIGTGISRGSIRKVVNDFRGKFERRAWQLKKELQEQQRLDKHEIVEKDLGNFTLVSGSIASLRDDDGNLILYADSSDPSMNIDRHDQYVSVELYSDIYDVDAAIDAVDFSIFELKTVNNRIDLLDNFLRTFRAVLPDIPDEDLQFIIRRGVEEQNGEIIDPEEFDRLTEGDFSSIIQRMIDLQDSSAETEGMVTSLQTQVASLTTQLEAMGELVVESSANDAGLDLVSLIRRVAAELRERALIEGDIEEVPSADGPPSRISIRAYKAMGTRLGEDLSNFSNIDELQLDVTFMTLLGETTTMRTSIPTELVVPPVTTINGFREEVTGVRIRLVQTGDFKGWFKNDLKISSATEYVTGVLVPGETIQLKAAYDIHVEPNAGIPDDRFVDEVDDILDRKRRRRVTIPDGDEHIPDGEDEDTIVAPPGRVSPESDPEFRQQRRRQQQRRGKSQGDPDMPKIPLTDDEIAVEELSTEEQVETGLVEQIDPSENVLGTAVTDTTPSARETIVVIPPVPKTSSRPIPTVGIGTGGVVGIGTRPASRRNPPPRRTTRSKSTGIET